MARVVKNGSPSRARKSAGIPVPSSATRTATRSAPRAQLTRTRPPCGIASSAFCTRLSHTCLSAALAAPLRDRLERVLHQVEPHLLERRVVERDPRRLERALALEHAAAGAELALD